MQPIPFPYAPYVFFNRPDGTGDVHIFLLVSVKSGEKLSEPSLPTGTSEQKTYSFTIIPIALGDTAPPYPEYAQKQFIVSVGNITMINIKITDPNNRDKTRIVTMDKDDWDTSSQPSVTDEIAYNCPYICLHHEIDSIFYSPMILLPLKNKSVNSEDAEATSAPEDKFITTISLGNNSASSRIHHNLITNTSPPYDEVIIVGQDAKGWFEANISGAGTRKVKIKNRNGNPMPNP